MFLHLILFTLTANNINPSTNLNKNSQTKKGDRMCDNCLSLYINNLDMVVDHWERNEERRNQIDESCLRRLVRRFFSCFGYVPYAQLQNEEDP